MQQINELAERLRTYTARDYKELETTKEAVQEEYDRLKEVSETLTHRELSLIWYIRNIRPHESYRYHRIAKANYEAERALQNITSNEAKEIIRKEKESL